jgi:predicted  nucleic acid-binding Zn-ribbon protein
VPHQCLKCGTLFPEGTTTILRGCPDCHGTRFFYTQEALTLSERERMLNQTERELPILLENLAAAPAPSAPPKGPAPEKPPLAPERLPVPEAFDEPRGRGEVLADGRLVVRLPRELNQRVRRATSGWDYEAPVPKPVPPPFELSAPRRADEPVAPEIPRPAPAALPLPPPEPSPASVPQAEVPLDSETRPETVRIEDLGKYEIDVRRLLERNPIIVQKDGSYVLHLPSLFEMPPKDK